MSASNRSQISNGRRNHTRGKHGGVDGRSRTGRRWRDLLEGFTLDLTAARGRSPSAVEASLLRQATTLSLVRERLEAQAASGELVNSEELTGLCSELRRVLTALDLHGEGAVPPETRRLDQLLGSPR